VPEQEYSCREGAKKISTLHDCWFPALRRTAACSLAAGSKTRIAQVNPGFSLFEALGQLERDLIRERTRAGLATAA
jgi:hypothetical protein